MATSRAWTFTARGAPRSVLSLTPRPVPTLPPAAAVISKSKDSNEWLLIKVAYAALNPGGHFYVSMIPAAARAKTAVPEMDLSGVVADVWTPSASSSAAKARFRKGDRVAAFIPVSFGWATGTGALAEHVVLPAKNHSTTSITPILCARSNFGDTPKKPVNVCRMRHQFEQDME
ncbi:Zinc-type alcohol dehydrogenase-like protein [Colletotrichum sp. SAR 10_65]|nr:Zinc-type alcohol dehydrogenase-like protein [Colletotrichum sp. SAR 10_65]